jgi:hypothetical protein
VLAVVDLLAVDLERGGFAAEQTSALKKLNLKAALFQLDRRAESGKPGADDC